MLVFCENRCVCVHFFYVNISLKVTECYVVSTGPQFGPCSLIGSEPPCPRPIANEQVTLQLYIVHSQKKPFRRSNTYWEQHIPSACPGWVPRGKCWYPPYISVTLSSSAYCPTRRYTLKIEGTPPKTEPFLRLTASLEWRRCLNNTEWDTSSSRK